MKQTEIPIFFSVDDGYAPYLAVALRSAVANSSPHRRYRAVVMHQELSAENRQKLATLAAPHFAIDFVEMRQGLESITDRLSNRLRCEYFTLTIYFRLFIPTLFPQYDKGIYLDSDVVVLGDLADLFAVPLEGALLGACHDLSVAEAPPLVTYMEQAVGVPSDKYVNSGVLLMDLNALRECGFEQHFLNLLNTYHFDSIAPDQDYINAICVDRIRYLDKEWDAMPNEHTPAQESPKLVHYNLFSKPWCYSGVQYESYFWQYCRDSGYYEQIKAFKDGFDEEKRQREQACFQRMVQRAIEICGQTVTFRRMAQQGVSIRL